MVLPSFFVFLWGSFRGLLCPCNQSHEFHVDSPLDRHNMSQGLAENTPAPIAGSVVLRRAYALAPSDVCMSEMVKRHV